MICTTPNCGQEVRANGICSQCYETIRLGNIPIICVVKGCHTHVHQLAKRPLCTTHRELIPEPKRPRQPRKPREGEKINAEDVKAIRRRFADGDMLKNLATEYGISVSMASHITSGRKWQHVPDTPDAPITKRPRGRRYPQEAK